MLTLRELTAAYANLRGLDTPTLEKLVELAREIESEGSLILRRRARGDESQWTNEEVKREEARWARP